ncbi:MAG: HDOD domain-containing protein, partial [Planctomycetota bacterium]
MSTADDLSDLLARVRSPMSLPDSFTRIDAVVRSPTSDARHIAEAVGMDQAMAARLLRLANSPLYGFSSRVDTITRAVAVIGTRQIRDLAMASAVLSLCNGMVCPGISATAFWTHSFAVASLARSLAAARRDPNPERYFLAGLLTTI